MTQRCKWRVALSVCTLLRTIGLSNTQTIGLAENLTTLHFQWKIIVLYNKVLLKFKILNFHRIVKTHLINPEIKKI